MTIRSEWSTHRRGSRSVASIITAQGLRGTSLGAFNARGDRALDQLHVSVRTAKGAVRMIGRRAAAINGAKQRRLGYWVIASCLLLATTACDRSNKERSGNSAPESSPGAADAQSRPHVTILVLASGRLYLRSADILLGDESQARAAGIDGGWKQASLFDLDAHLNIVRDKAAKLAKRRVELADGPIIGILVDREAPWIYADWVLLSCLYARLHRMSLAEAGSARLEQMIARKTMVSTSEGGSSISWTRCDLPPRSERVFLDEKQYSRGRHLIIRVARGHSADKKDGAAEQSGVLEFDPAQASEVLDIGKRALQFAATAGVDIGHVQAKIQTDYCVAAGHVVNLATSLKRSGVSRVYVYSGYYPSPAARMDARLPRGRELSDAARNRRDQLRVWWKSSLSLPKTHPSRDR